MGLKAILQIGFCSDVFVFERSCAFLAKCCLFCKNNDHDLIRIQFRRILIQDFLCYVFLLRHQHFEKNKIPSHSLLIKFRSIILAILAHYRIHPLCIIV